MAKEYARQFYSSKAWQDCRNEYMKCAGYLCEDCMKRGIYRPGVEVHHVEELKPWNIHRPEVTLNFDNLVCLCRECHKARHKGQKGTQWADYVDRYADWIVTNKVEKFFELDLDSIMEFSQVMALRQRLESRTGKQCIPVWHKSRGKEQFVQDCKDYPYIALGGIAIKEIKPQEHKYFPWFIETAHEHGAKIHGLGYTNMNGLRKYHFDSVDSTRWNCARFGRVEYFTGRSMKQVDKRKLGFRVKNQQEVIRFTFNEWVKFQKYAETHL